MGVQMCGQSHAAESRRPEDRGNSTVPLQNAVSQPSSRLKASILTTTLAEMQAAPGGETRVQQMLPKPTLDFMEGLSHVGDAHKALAAKIIADGVLKGAKPGSQVKVFAMWCTEFTKKINFIGECMAQARANA